LEYRKTVTLKNNRNRILPGYQELVWSGAAQMDFQAFDKRKQDEYSGRAKELYGNTPE
jgi:hypothetical protein